MSVITNFAINKIIKSTHSAKIRFQTGGIMNSSPSVGLSAKTTIFALVTSDHWVSYLLIGGPRRTSAG